MGITKKGKKMNKLKALYFSFYVLETKKEKYDFILKNLGNSEFKINWYNLLFFYK